MFNSIAEAILQHAQERPDALAVASSGQRLNYAQLCRRVWSLARYFRSVGLERGQCVAMQSEQTVWFAVCQFATHLAGGIFVPIEQTMGMEGMRAILGQVDARICVAKVKVDGEGLFIASEEISALSEGVGVEAEGEMEFPKAEEPAEILFTTGTTGKSKGVLCSHRSVVAVAENLAYGMKYQKDTLILVPGKLNHANAIRKLEAAFFFGSGVVILDGLSDMKAFFQAIEELKVTALCLPPAAVRMILVLSGDRIGKYRDQIDFVESGTAFLPETDKQRLCELLPGSRLYNSYGTSEAGSSCMYDYNGEKGLVGCIGRPAVNARFEVVDDQGKVMTSSKQRPGLIRYGGSMVMMGYWKEPELTRGVLVDGMIRTSDMGYIDEENRVYVIGRRDDVINVGGNKVAPDEVEAAALGIEGIAECGCVRMEDKLLGEAVRLVVVMKEGYGFDVGRIRKGLKERLEEYKVPKKIEQRATLPRSANGKLNRNAL